MRQGARYSVSAKLRMDGEIDGAQCECTAGCGPVAHCKHVIVLLLGISDMSRRGTIVLQQTCTQKLQTFHQPQTAFMGSPVRSNEMRSINRNTAVAQWSMVDRDGDSDSDIETYRNHFRNVCIAGGLNSTMPIKQLFMPANPYAVETDHDYCKYTKQHELLRDLKLTDITDEDVTKIEMQTVGQAENPSWHEYRSSRITASHFYDCCKVTKDDSGMMLADKLLHPTPVRSKATTHGIIHEKTAINELKKAMGYTDTEIRSCGLYIMRSHLYLGASPDRLLMRFSIVEVKCPYSARDQMINPQTVPYLTVDETNRLTLKKSHRYYYQIQGQLMVTGKEFCDLLVFTFKDMRRISIERDEKFIAEMLKELTNFYETCFKPSVFKKCL